MIDANGVASADGIILEIDVNGMPGGTGNILFPR